MNRCWLAAFAVATFAVTSADTPVPRLAAGTLVDHAKLARLSVGDRVELRGFALDDRTAVDLELERFELLAPGAGVVVGGEGGERPLALPDIVLLRGTVSGEPDSLAFVGVSPYGTHGFVRRAGGLHVLSTGPHRAHEDRLFELKVTDAAELGAPRQDHPGCGVTDGAEWVLATGGGGGGVAGEPPCRVALVAIDSDWEFTGNVFAGDTSASAAYAIILLGAVSEIYARDTNTRLLVSFLRVWESDSDPYNPNGIFELHDQFRSHWVGNHGDVERDIAHLLSGRFDLPYGGIAWVGVVCNTAWGYGVSGYLAGTFPYPLQDNDWGNWDPFVVAHEVGHNFGTLHTHDGYDPPIDNCGNGDCTGASEGTIMSYCHVCPGGMSNIVLRFHELVIDVILSYLDGNGCDITDTGANAVDDQAHTIEDEPVMVDILLNDLAMSCDEGAVVLDAFDSTSVAGGIVELVPAGGENERDQLRYTPPPGFGGPDSFGYSLVGGESATVGVDVEPLREPDETGPTGAGAAVDYYALQTPSALPDFDALTPYASDVVPDVNYEVTSGEFATSGLSEEVGAVFTGFVTVAEDGLYSFYTNSDDGSALYIGDQLVVSNDGLHGMVERTGSIALSAGPHAIRVEFFERFGGAGLIVSYEGPGLAKQPIPGSAWSHALPCPADIDGDGLVNITDFLALLAAWGQSGVPEDINGDGIVNIGDLLMLLVAWGPC